MAKTLWLIKCQKLEECAFVLFQFKFQLNAWLSTTLEGLYTCVVLPDETLKFGWTICQFWASLWQNFIWVRFMHVICHSFASLVLLISLNETTLERIILFEFVISCCFIVAKNRGNSEIFWTSVKNNSCWLWCWWSHPDSTEIDGIISTVKRNLKLEIISIINSFVSLFTYQLSGMSVCMCFTFIINFILCVCNYFIINCFLLLGQICNWLLSNWFTNLSSLLSS